MVLILFPFWILIGETLDKIPRGEPVAECRDDRSFSGEVKSSTCGYRQEFGWPFVEHKSFQSDKRSISVDNAASVSRRGLSWNQLVITGIVASGYVFLRNRYWDAKFRASKKYY